MNTINFQIMRILVYKWYYTLIDILIIIICKLKNKIITQNNKFVIKTQIGETEIQDKETCEWISC